MTAQEGSATLQAGTLKWSVSNSYMPVESLCRFGTRRSRRRGFVFLSTVLGKHIPVAPSLTTSSQKALAARLPDADNVIFVGLAETAIGLAQGVFEAYLEQRPDCGALFTHTTRHQLAANAWYTSQEPHSHAPDHLGYGFATPLLEKARNARTLVLVDDEISTGTTLLGLAEVLRQRLPAIEHVVLACLTDWSGPAGHARFAAAGASVVSLCQGSYSFEPNPDYQPDAAPDARGASLCLEGSILKCHGRVGRSDSLPECPLSPADLGIPPNSTILVLGTGEFLHAPLRLALAWEQSGHRVLFQSTSRSPLAVGDGIGTARHVSDHYGDGAPYYLYNHESAGAGRIVVCHETPHPPVIENPGCPVISLRFGEDGSCVR
jgi:orotate phosphoribosyltransferase